MNDTEIIGLMFGLLGGMMTSVSGWAWYKPYRSLTLRREKRPLKWFAILGSGLTLAWHAMILANGIWDLTGGRLGKELNEVYLMSCALGVIMGLLICMAEAIKDDGQAAINRRPTSAY